MSRPAPLVSSLVLLALAPASARAALWEPKPGVALTADDGVAQRLELVDLDADGFVDIVVANSSGGSIGSDADAQLNRIFLNLAGEKFVELNGVFDEPDNAFVIKAGDVDGDGDGDLVVGVNFSGDSYLLINDGGAFTRQELFPQFPDQELSIGDLELGDVDGDGDLDILAADWGSSQPYGDPADPGAPLHLWLGQGDGTFTDGSAFLPLGMEAQLSWSFDLELLDLDNDFDLDVAVASRGPGDALVLVNDGTGFFMIQSMPALQGKDINLAFTPIDLDGDASIDLVTLQDGGDDCEVQDGGKVCGSRNSILVNDGQGGFTDATATFWPPEHNPPGADLDAATLDLDNDGTPDLVVSGQRLGPVDNSTLLLHNSGAALSIAAVDPLGPALDLGIGLMFADFDHDRREDVAVAVRDDALPNLLLFGRAEPPDPVPEDITPPRIAPFETLPDLLIPGKTALLRARIHDQKTPTRWHDFQHEPALETLNLIDGAGTAHRRRLPYVEFALGLANPDELASLPDTGPQKVIVPGVWYGESLWSFSFLIPLGEKQEDTLTYNICAIDAAINKTCIGPFQALVDDIGEGLCGDGLCSPFEDPESCPFDCPCDNDGVCEMAEAEHGMCCDCDGGDCPSMMCGDGFCQAPQENFSNCPDDCQACDNDALCEPGEGQDCCDCSFCEPCGDGICAAPEETALNCPVDCDPGCVTDGCTPPVCGDCLCEPGESLQSCPGDCGADECAPPVCGDDLCSGFEDPDNCPNDCPGDTDSATGGGSDIVEPGCLCRDAPASGALGLLLLLARRRRARLS